MSIASGPESAGDYDRRATLHKPGTAEEMAAAVKSLLAQGLTARDVSIALRMNEAEVIGLAKLL